MQRMNRRALGLLLAAGLLLPCSAASADVFIKQAGRHDSSVELELHGIARWQDRVAYNGLGTGVGLRLGIPIIRNGFISRLNNQVAINFGADLFFWPYYNSYVNLVIPVTLQWSFYLAGIFSFFAEAGVGLEWFPNGDPGHVGWWGTPWLGFWPGLAVGCRFHFGGNARFPALTLRAGFPSGFNVGVSF
jgi:hypothetical protein